MRKTPTIPLFLALAIFPVFFLSPVHSQELIPVQRPAKDSAARADSAKAAQAAADSVLRAAGDTAAIARAAADSARNDTVSYSASRIRYRDDRFSLSDKALLTYRGSSMVADSIVYWSKDNVVEAMGAPLITDPANPPILGYKMRYNLKSKVGEIYYGSSTKGNQSFNGVEVRRQKDGDIYIARGDFSTCVLPYKHYYFYSRRMILEPKAKVLSGPIVMDIADVPVAVLPMMVMPLGTGRRSGLLQPKIGGDQSQGFYMNNLGYYWAINEYSDYRMAGDIIEGEAGTFDKTNVNAEYRYNVRYLLNGMFGGTYYIEEFDPRQSGWSANYVTDWSITPDRKQTLIGSGSFLSSQDIVRDNAITEEQKAKQTANAKLGYQRGFEAQGARLGINFDQANNLETGQLERTLPGVTFGMGGPLFPAARVEAEPFAPRASEEGPEDDPWYRKLEYTYDANGSAFYRRSPASIAGAAGDTNTYVGYKDAFTLSGKYNAFQYVNLTPNAVLEQMWSLDSRDPSAPGGKRTAWDPAAGDLGEYFAAYRAGITADTRFFGIAQAADKPWFGTVQGLRHTVVPRLGYTYAPELDSNPRFVPSPATGGNAFQAEQQSVSVALENELDMKLAPSDSALKAAPGTGAAAVRKGEPYKLGSSSSSASYNFASKTREWSPVTSTFTLYLTKNVPFTLGTTHMLYDDFGARPNSLTTPILTAYRFGWRRGIQVGGNFNSGLRVRDTRGFPGAKFENSPWSADANYSFDFSSTRVGGEDADPVSRFFGGGGSFRHTRTHSATGGLKLNPTAGWQMAYDTDYNFSEGRFSKHAFSFHRVLHCWEMDFRWSPVGISEGWNFVIRITDLPDVKLESSDTKSRRRR